MTVLLEKQKQTACQKHALFKTYFGELLLPHGFRHCSKRFIRFHENQLILCVSMDLHRTGKADIRFGAMPLCAGGFDPQMRFGECLLTLADTVPEEENSFAFQLELFTQYFLDVFVSIDNTRSLLDFQERVLEDRFSAMPVDWAYWESLYLRDYDRAYRYAALWSKQLADEAEAYRSQGRADICAADLTEANRTHMLRSFSYYCDVLRHNQYYTQRLMHLLDIGAYGLLNEMILQNIAESTDSFHNAFPDYRK